MAMNRWAPSRRAVSTTAAPCRPPSQVWADQATMPVTTTTSTEMLNAQASSFLPELNIPQAGSWPLRQDAATDPAATGCRAGGSQTAGASI